MIHFLFPKFAIHDSLITVSKPFEAICLIIKSFSYDRIGESKNAWLGEVYEIEDIERNYDNVAVFGSPLHLHLHSNLRKRWNQR